MDQICISDFFPCIHIVTLNLAKHKLQMALNTLLQTGFFHSWLCMMLVITLVDSSTPIYERQAVKAELKCVGGG